VKLKTLAGQKNVLPDKNRNIYGESVVERRYKCFENVISDELLWFLTVWIPDPYVQLRWMQIQMNPGKI